jgi:hypothetical protein
MTAAPPAHAAMCSRASRSGGVQVVAFEQKMAELQLEINRKMEAERRKQEAVQR